MLQVEEFVELSLLFLAAIIAFVLCALAIRHFMGTGPEPGKRMFGLAASGDENTSSLPRRGLHDAIG